jgi:uncharacterized protein (DUF2384 family)
VAKILHIDYNYPELPSLESMVSEPEAAYWADMLIFSTDDFEELSAIMGFSQAEWSAMLHISDRTLQRYLKEGKPFDGLQAEWLTHFKKMTQLGLRLFGSGAALAAWLRQDKIVLGKALGFDALKSISGLQLLKKELGRMAYGVYI